MVSKVLLSDFHRSKIKNVLNFSWKSGKCSGISKLPPLFNENESKKENSASGHHYLTGKAEVMKLFSDAGQKAPIHYIRKLGQGPLTRLQFKFILISQSVMSNYPQIKFGIPCTEEPMEVEDYPHPVALSSGVQTEDENCVICMDDITNRVVLEKCSHAFCKDCITSQFKYKAACPVCGTVYGKITGNQPHGTIYFRRLNQGTSVPGYEGFGVISVSYSFPNGIQTAEHPNPGIPYSGTSRTGYLPESPDGIKVAKMLKVAFDRRLVFTVGRSRTTGADNVVTWNDIHHKTCLDGGPENFGYPDPTYLSRVQEELAAKGVVESDTYGVVLNFS